MRTVGGVSGGRSWVDAVPSVLEEWRTLTGTQLFLKQQHLVTEGLDPVSPAPQLGHLFGLQLFRRHGQHCSDPGPSLCGPLQRKQYLRIPARSWGVALAHPAPAPAASSCRLACSNRSRRSRSSATSLRVRSSRSASRTRAKETEHGLLAYGRDPGPPRGPPIPTRHTEDAGTRRGFQRPRCTGASVRTQSQRVRAAARVAAQGVETAVRAEGRAGPAFIDV